MYRYRSVSLPFVSYHYTLSHLGRLRLFSVCGGRAVRRAGVGLGGGGKAGMRGWGWEEGVAE